MCTPLKGRQVDLDRSLGVYTDEAKLPRIGRNKPVILPPLGEPVALDASWSTGRREAASAAAADSKATAATSLTDDDRPGDVNEAEGRRSPLDSVRQQESSHRHGLGYAAADGGAHVDNAFPDGCGVRTNNGEHRQANHENTVVADSKDAKMHLDKEKDDKDLNTCVINNSALAARSLEPIPARVIKVPFAEGGKGAWGGGGAGPLSSPGTGFRSRIGDGLRNLLTLGSEAQITPASCLPRSQGNRPVPGHQQQTKARGLSPLSWSRRKLLRNENDVTGKVLPASLVDGSDERVDGGSKKGARRSLDGGLDSGGDLPARGFGGNSGGSCGGGSGSNYGDANDGEGKVGVEGGQAGGKEVAAAGSTWGRRDSGGRRRSNNVIREGEGVDSKAVEDAGGVGQVAAIGNNSVATGTPADGDIDGSVIVADVKDAGAGATQGHALRVLAQNNTLVARDLWPSPLDDEADPDGWALDKSEADVLAAARRTGSVLVRVVTWNLHAKPTPPVEKLREDLLPPGKFHIYAIGTEECLNSIAKSVIVHSKKEWESTVKEILGSSYEMLCGHALQATHNTVFAHRGIVPLLRNVRSSAVATGLSLGAPGTTLGNKGGVGISFNLGATSCIFVNSHLAAHQNNVRERNEHFFQISSELVRELRPEPAAPCGPPPKSELLDVASSSMPLSGSSPSPVAADGGGGRGGNEKLPVSTAGTGDTESRRQSPGEDQKGCLENKPFTRPPSETAGGLPDTPQRMQTPSHVVASSPHETANQIQEPPVKNATKTETKGGLTNLEREKKENKTATTTPPLSPYPVVAQQQQPECPPSPSSRDSIGHPLHRPPSRGSIGHLLHRASAERISDGSNSTSTPGRATSGRGGDRSKGNNSKTLPEVFDRVVWAGDLNYRVNVRRDAADLLLSEDMHGILLQNEQLSIERERGGLQAPFTGYREGPLNFRPTYKFDSGLDTYDTSSKRRVPAWTDRVLFASAVPQIGRGKEKDEKEMQQGRQDQGQRGRDGGEQKGGGQEGALTADRLHLRAYRSVPDLRTSDHRPVIASFVLEFDQRGDGDITDSGGAAVTNQTSSEVCLIM